MQDPRAARWLWFLVPLLLWSGSALLRVHLTLSDPEFDTHSSAGLLKSDPGLLFYLTQRVLDAGGRPPPDWHADPRIEHPDRVDVPAVFTVGQEFLVARLYRLFGGDLPLHVFCVWLMGFVASLAVFAVFGAARELTRSPRWATVAALLYTFTPANYRTVGFILVREDLSLPLYAIHLWALSRALAPRAPGSSRRRTVPAFLAVLALAGALATWHGMGFLVAMQALALLVVFVRSGANPFAGLTGRLALPALLAACALVPALRPKLAQGPLWVALAVAPWLAGVLPERLRGTPAARLGLCGALLAALLALARLASPDAGDLSHVTALVSSKLIHLGRFPDDPSRLPFDVRLLWQGPFATASAASLGQSLLLLALLLPAAWTLVVLASSSRSAATARGPRPSAALEALALFSVLGVVASWLVARVVVLPGLLGPLLVAVVAPSMARARAATAARALTVAVALQALLFARWAGNLQLPWYLPSLRQDEIAAMVRAVPAVVPEGQAIAADFMNSTAILAHTGHPIVLQPKWERAASRARVERFWMAFYHGTPEELRELLTTQLDCRYLLVDRFTLWILRASRAVAGLPPGLRAPLPGTAAEALLDPDTDTPGYRLIWRSPQTFLQSNGRPSDFFRLYRLDG